MAPRPAEVCETADAESSLDDRREAERYAITFKMSVSVDRPGGNGVTVSPAAVLNISRVGALVETRHPLATAQSVALAIPTALCPDGMRMPQAFIGSATVVRAAKVDHGKCVAALRFGETLTQNMEFTMYMEFLQSTSMNNWLQEH